MTSGTKTYSSTVDTMWTQETGATGYGKSGRGITRVWSGTDEPPRARPMKDYRESTTIRWSKGKKIVYRFRWNAASKPARAKKVWGLHPYTSTTTHDYYPVGLCFVRGTITSSGAYYSTNYTNNCSIQVVADCPTMTAVPLSSNANNALVNKLGSKLKGSDFNLTTFLGESNQTLRMLGDTVNRIHWGIRLTREGRPDLAWKILVKNTSRRNYVNKPPRLEKMSRQEIVDASSEVAARNWLAMMYGWLPLYDDVVGAAEMLSHRLSVPFREVIRMGMRPERTTFRNRYGHDMWVGVGTPSPGALVYKEAFSEVSRRITAYVTEPPSLPALTGLKNLAPTAWELVPFSFAADWFLPIGQYLEARSNASMLSGTFVISELQRSRHGQVTCDPYQVGGVSYRTTLAGLDKGFRETVKFQRTISPILATQLPSWKPLSKALSWEHCANAVALVTSAFVGGPAPKTRVI